MPTSSSAASPTTSRLTYATPRPYVLYVTRSPNAASERRIAEAVAAAREADVSWSAIGGMLGTSGEAARKRYGANTKTI